MRWGLSVIVKDNLHEDWAVKHTRAGQIMVALDVDELDQAIEIAESLKGLGATFKIGNQLGTYEGWQKAVQFAAKYDAKIFCDTKFKDIPATVGKSCTAISRHRPDFFNIMADNSLEALRAAVAGVGMAVQTYGVPRPVLLGVTVLTSMSEDDCVSIYGAKPAQKVLQFAIAAADAGLDGVVCSPKEAALLKANPKTSKLLLVTPGIRPSWAAAGDQQRITTPKQALENGADYLVIGRPITRPPPEIGTPRDAFLKILKESGE